MTTINVTGAYRNPQSPKIAGKSFSSARPAAGNFRIVVTGAEAGEAPNVVEWRPFIGAVHGADINLSPNAGEVGTYLNNLSSLPKFYQNSDGFTGMAARVSRIGPETSLYLNYPDSSEFRTHFIETVPTDWCFPGTSIAKTQPTTSVLKDVWDTRGDGQGGLADICEFTCVGENISISGNSSQPNFGVSPLVKFEDYWDFNGRNCFGHYQRAGSPDPIVNNGYLEAYFSSKITGTTKPTNTLFISANAPVFGTGTDIEAGQTLYNRAYKWAYFVTPSGAKLYVPNLLTQYSYKAVGANSYQCLFLMNANARDSSSLLYAYKSSSWNNATGIIDFSTNTFDMTYATHGALLKSNGTWQIDELENLRI